MTHTSHDKAGGTTSERLTFEQIRSIVGDIADPKATAIAATGASADELWQAYLYAQGYGDVLDRSGHSLTGVVAEIYDILTADEELDER
ncbi:MAG TPA: hypothetical protein VF342_13260 [Alphaproteobacteria bacterium]